MKRKREVKQLASTMKRKSEAKQNDPINKKESPGSKVNKKQKLDEKEGINITHEHLTRSSNKRSKDKQNQNNPSSSTVSHADVGNASLKRRLDPITDEFISNFWEKSKQKYQKTKEKNKRKKSAFSVFHCSEEGHKESTKSLDVKQTDELENETVDEQEVEEIHSQRNSDKAKTTHEISSPKAKQRKSKSRKKKLLREMEDEISNDLLPTTTSTEADDEEFSTSENTEKINKEEEVKKGIHVIDSHPGVIIALEKDSEISFQGSCRFVPICGTVSVLGSHLISGKHYELFSADTNSFLTLKCEKVESNPKENILEDFKVYQQINKMVAAVKVEYLESRLCDIIPKYPPFQQIFRSKADNSGLPEWKQLLSRVGLSINDGPKIGFPKIYDTIKDITEDLISDSDKSGCLPVITIIGGKNSGKSTTNRFLVNSLLNKIDKVFFLECDVGQTELTPPGCVSLHCISEPLLGPPFAHQREAVSSFYFGGVTPADDPTRYLTCIEQCFSKYLEINEKIPLIVNTMGWNKGVGLALTVDTIRLVRPLLLVQINTQKNIVNFPPMSPEFVCSEPGWRGKIWDERWRYMDDMPQYKWITVESPVNSNDNLIGRYRPMDHRDLTLFSYFSKNLELGMNLTSVTPFRIPWRSVAIHVCHTAIDKSQIMYSINGSLVALCHADLTYAEKFDEDAPWIFDNTPVCQCFGFGIVRGIDPIKQEVYIATPLTLQQLQNVNALLKGAVNLPNQLLLKQKCEGPMLYVTTPIITTGSEVLRQRQPPRKLPVV